MCNGVPGLPGVLYWSNLLVSIEVRVLLCNVLKIVAG